MSRILIIDDNLELRIHCRDYLRDQSYEVDDCGSGMEALVKIKKNKYDVIVSDNQMPGILGIHLIPSLKNTGAKVIFVSGSFMKDVVLQAHKLGVDKILCKQFTLSDLDAAITSCLCESVLDSGDDDDLDLLKAS